MIYGYSGSAAESFANENGYIFEAVGGSGNGGEGGNGGDDGDGGNGGDGKKDDDKKNNNGGSTGGNTNGTTATSGSRTTVARAGTSASKNMGTAQVSSGTPKTGIDFDARYMLCAGFFLAGACLVITRKKKNIKA